MKINIISSSWIKRDGIRLGGQYHCSDGQTALRNLEESNINTTPLLDLCKAIFIPSRFKRPYVEDPNYGLPYITGSRMLLFQPKEDGTYLSRVNTPNLDQLLLQYGTILVTCSGIIGRCVIVNQDLAECIGSPDLLRIIPNPQKIKSGYLYAFLTSSVGQSLMRMQTYGSVVDHIEAHHVFNLPVPLFNQNLETELDKKIFQAWDNRERANKLLKKAQSSLFNTLGLPKFSKVQNLGDSTQQRAYKLVSTDLDLRLDASFYAPNGRKAIEFLENRPDHCLLGDVTKRIFHPFRMNMVLVDKDFGVPFLGGGDIVQIRYYGDKYISSVTDHYEDYLLQRNWTLMTIGGTVGRITYVGDYLNGMAASQHVTRIVPNESQLMPGYLYAFMESEYAQYQIQNLVYGSVVDTIRESQLKEIHIPIPSLETQKPIHNLVEEAYTLRYEANKLEDEAHALLYEAIDL